MTSSPGSMCNLGTINFSAVSFEESKLEWRADNSDNDMCQMDDINKVDIFYLFFFFLKFTFLICILCFW